MQREESDQEDSPRHPRLAPNGGADRRKSGAAAQEPPPSLHLLAQSTFPTTEDLPLQTNNCDVKNDTKKQESSESVDSPPTTERLPTDPPGHHGTSASLAVRPGKKTLRKKVRHHQPQQDELSPVEVLWDCAQRLAASGHASIVQSTRDVRCLHANDNTSSSTAIPCPDRIQIATSTEHGLANAEAEEGPMGSEPATESTVTIRVKPLLVLDLNGILCHRVRHPHPPLSGDEVLRPSIATIARTPIIPRLDLIDFLQYVHQHFCVAVWTSAKAKNARLLLRALLPPELIAKLLFVYAQHHCKEHSQPPRRGTDPTADDNNDDHVPPTTSRVPYVKPLFEKDLSVVWKAFPVWDEHNTILYDDSPEKCLQWQGNAVHPPPLTGIDRYDEPTERQQRELIERLVEHWRQTPGMKTFHIPTGEQWWERSVRQAAFLRDEVARLGWTSASLARNS